MYRKRIGLRFDAGKKLVFGLIAGLLAIAWLTGCDECEDCSFSENEPYITLSFLDSTRYYVLTEDLMYLRDTLATLDSLETIARDSVESGNQSYEPELTRLENLSDSFGSLESIASTERSQVAAGSFFPEQIIPVGGNAYPDPPTDSVTSLTLPLPMDASGVAEYRIQIDGRTDTLVLSFRTFVIEKNNEYLVQAIDPEVLETSFPGGSSITCYNLDSCITDNAIVYVYY
ncbi:hypothetical protein AB9P05_15805 [Roseivirga sp. BDSF3-8]|uniref:hypothetical protein n=1 Tax=Roseivirga sp. BDSF3-8 TaxID=3241598 RepID=UPI0035318C19